MSLPRPNEIVILIDHPKNSDVVFFPIETSVRSHIYPTRSRGNMPQWAIPYALTGIPGQRIHLNVKDRCGRITDALGDPQNAEIASVVDRNGFGTAVPDKNYTDLSPEDVQTWLYWMRRMVTDQYHSACDHTKDKSGQEHAPMGTHARLIQGTLPELEDIIATGKARRPIYNGELKDGVSHYYQPPKSEKTEKELVGAK